MTGEEAIKHLQQFWNSCNSWETPDEEGKKACELAIDALRAEPKYLYDAETDKFVVLPCEDAVSREAAITAMKYLEERDIEAYGCKIPEGFDATDAIKALMDLPSVTPARKTGKWNIENDEYIPLMYVCSNCGFTWKDADSSGKYCPMCGAEMEKGENR